MGSLCIVDIAANNVINIDGAAMGTRQLFLFIVALRMSLAA